MELNKKETLRYLGYKGQEIDDKLLSLIEETSNELLHLIMPKSVHKEFACSILENNTVQLGPLMIPSKNLVKNLTGCEKAIIFAATIGPAADQLIKKYSILNLAKASVVQAAGASLIETYCDTLEEAIRIEANAQGLYLRPRFSPGYGDFPLDYQENLFTILECNKRIGISLTDTYLMYPSKSVTAIIGLSTMPKASCEEGKCQACTKISCEYRDAD